MVEVLGGFGPMICPECKQDRAHRSHAAGFKDRIYKLFEMIPYRCHECRVRFYAYRAGEQSSKLRTREEQSIMQLRRRIRWRHTKRQLAAYSLAAFLLLGILYVMMQQKIVPE